ncbi:MAG: hypothetical protein Q8L78_00485 [Coxiellaceae bacterium]|nr:hypothetical protein [Coxiellaceae bacterium]
MRENHWQANWLDTSPVVPYVPDWVIDRLGKHADPFIDAMKLNVVAFCQWVSATRFTHHEKQILSSILPFIESCQTSVHAPEISHLTKKIFNQDIALVLLVNCAYYFLEYHVNKLEGAFYAFPLNVTLTFLSAGLLLFTLPYSAQFFLHKMALLQRLPDMFRLMGLESKRQEISNAVCADCNRLRHNKGLFRDLVTYGFQQGFLFAIRTAPYLVSPAGFRAVSWLSLIAYPFEWLFTGQLLLGYPMFAAGICQRDVLANLQEYPEFYLALGATYHASVALITWTISLLLRCIAFTPVLLWGLDAVIGKVVSVPYSLISESAAFGFSLLGSVIRSTELLPDFVYNGIALGGSVAGALDAATAFTCEMMKVFVFYMTRFLLEPWGQLPASIYENFLAGFLTIAFVGLAHHIPFPTIVSKSTRFRPDILTCVFADLFTDASIYLMKERILKRAGERKNQLLVFQKAAVDFYANAKLTAMEAYFFISERKNSKMNAYLMQFLNYAVNHGRMLLPTLLRKTDAIYQDEIIELVLPKILVEAHNLFLALIEFRKRSKNMLSWVKKIDSFFSNRKVKIVSWIVGMKGVTDLLTLDFIINQSPAYIDELQIFLQWLKNHWIINDKFYSAVNSEINAFKKHLILVQKIIGGLPESFVEELVHFIKKEESDIYLRKGMSFVFEMLKKADPNLKNIGDELFEQFVLLTDKKEECDFSEKTVELQLQSSDFHRHFQAGSTISFSAGQPPVISYVEEDDFAVVTQSSEVPSAMVFQQPGARPVLVAAPSSDGFDSDDIPSDGEAFEEKFSSAAFQEKKRPVASNFFRAMATTSKEKLASVAKGLAPGA